MNGQAGYVNCESELNKISKIFGTGTEWYTLKKGEEVTLTSNSYYYMGSDAMGESSSNAYNMLFNINDNYWLASPVVGGYNGEFDYLCRCVFGLGYGLVAAPEVTFYASNGWEGNAESGVRTVVSLESDIKLTKEVDDTYSISE